MDGLGSIVQKRIRDTLLLDTYGCLLTEKQRLACELAWFQDFSLAEIAETLGISRQGVHDLISKARENMDSYEEKLSLLSQQEKLKELAELVGKHRTEISPDVLAAFDKLFED